MSLPYQPETPGIPGISDQQLVRYILGLLPEDETERLDEASIADDAVAERLRIVEDDLVDAYVRGTLDRATLERFETYYLSSPERREHVRFAASLVRVVDRAAPAGAGNRAASGTPSATQSAGATATGVASTRSVIRAWVLSGLAAAAVLLIAASAALLYETTRLSRGLSAAQQQSAALDQRAHELERQLEDERRSAAAAASELTHVRGSGAESASQSGAGRSGAAAPAPAFALVLLPQTRAIGPIATLAMSPGADRVAFDLRLETNDFSEYQIGLRDPATNDIIWRSEWIAPHTSADQPSVSLTIPAGLLKAQHYAIELTGHGGAGTGQVVGSYAFQIVPR
jgi:hypothetical protein